MFKVEEDSDTHSIRRIGSIDVDGEITCLSLGPGFTIMAGIRRGSDILLGWGSVQYAYLEMINVTDGKFHWPARVCPALFANSLTPDGI